MKIITKNFTQTEPSVSYDFFTEDALLFDIETTGLSKTKHQIYLIGCAHRVGTSITVHQFFAQSPSDESLILENFLSLTQDYDTLISFNGKRFDEPFIREKCKEYNLDDELLCNKHLDIYEECKKLKPFLSLSSLRQKSIEEFLGIERDDQYDGGQLISVYKNYVAHQDPESLELLLLHNYEDVIGMILLLPILSYHQLITDKCHITSYQLEEHTDMYSNLQKEILFQARLSMPLPVSIRLHRMDCHLMFEKDSLRGSIPLYKGTLKHYLSNYKDYVYLPEEDMIVLKSMATCIDTSRKEKATASNCYIKKEGYFLLLPQNFSPGDSVYRFAEEHKASEEYILYDETIIDEAFLSAYISSFITQIK